MCKFVVSGFVIVFLISLSDAIKERCNHQEDLIHRCQMALPVLSSREISFALTQSELEKSCIGLRSGINCIENYTNVCMEGEERVRFLTVYSGITKVVTDLCQPGEYQDTYLKHAECVKYVRPEYEKCSRRYEMTLSSLSRHHQSEQHQDGASHDYRRTVCCSFREYLECSTKTVLASCGEEAARFTDDFLKKMSQAIMKNFCLEYRGHECSSPDSGMSLEHSVLMISIAALANLAAYTSNALLPT